MKLFPGHTIHLRRKNPDVQDKASGDIILSEVLIRRIERASETGLYYYSMIPDGKPAIWSALKEIIKMGRNELRRKLA